MVASPMDVIQIKLRKLLGILVQTFDVLYRIAFVNCRYELCQTFGIGLDLLGAQATHTSRAAVI